jgi:glyoxylase-like metal-dependent hydrolase (beta-lactamase superfamily II)
VEIKLKGIEPYRLDDDIIVLPVPGHTKGHTVLLFREKYLFTGDHLAWSPERNQLIAFRGATWYSWEALKVSMKRLAGYRFEWVLPGHGRSFYALPWQMEEEMKKCLRWL